MIEYNRDLVIGKVRQCFPNEVLEEIMSILDLYGSELYEKERERIQIAIIKVSEGNLDKLRESVKAAKLDFRDVLAWAEYPEEMSQYTWNIHDKEALNTIRNRDRRQYLEWLES